MEENDGHVFPSETFPAITDNNIRQFFLDALGRFSVHSCFHLQSCLNLIPSFGREVR